MPRIQLSSVFDRISTEWPRTISPLATSRATIGTSTGDRDYSADAFGLRTQIDF